MILIKNGVTQVLTNQTQIDAFLNNGWSVSPSVETVVEEDVKEPKRHRQRKTKND